MKKKQLTRRQLALRWCGIVLALAVLCLWLLPWNLTPEAAHHRQVKAEFGTSARVVCRQAAEDRELVLSRGEKSLFLGQYERTAGFLWESEGVRGITEEAGRPFAAGYLSHSVREGHNQENFPHYFDIHLDYYYIFGIVPDDAVKEIQIELDAVEGGHDQAVTLTAEDWILTDTGERLFLCALEPESGLYSHVIWVTGHRADGTTTQRYNLTGVSGWH